jgi:hypothetical protein
MSLTKAQLLEQLAELEKKEMAAKRPPRTKLPAPQEKEGDEDSDATETSGEDEDEDEEVRPPKKKNHTQTGDWVIYEHKRLQRAAEHATEELWAFEGLLEAGRAKKPRRSRAPRCSAPLSGDRICHKPASSNGCGGCAYHCKSRGNCSQHK